MKIDHHQQVHKDDGERQATQQSDVGGAHGLHLSPDHHLRSARKNSRILINDLLDVAGDGTQVATLYRAKNINHRLDIVMRYERHARRATDTPEAAQDLRRCPASAGDRDVLQVL